MIISVVIPLFNKASTVGRSVKSVQMQTRPVDEIVVVDDGSTDGSGDVLAHLQTPTLRLIRQRNAGVSSARNRGISESSGDVIAFLDADDEWRPDFLAAIERLSNRYPEAGAFATCYVRARDGGQSVNDPPFSRLLAREGLLMSYFDAAAGGAMPLSSSSIAIRRSTFDAVGTFEAGAVWGEDTEMWARIYLQLPIAYSMERLARLHIVAPNRASARVEPRPLIPVVRTLEKALDDGRIRAEDLPGAKRYIGQSIVFTVKANLYLGHRNLAAEQLKSLLRYPYGRRAYWFLMALTRVPHGCLRAGYRARQIAKGVLSA